MNDGCVYLVGAGPGDPGLLTVKATQVLAAADVVVYDHLVADSILDRLPPVTERIYAGKETSSHTMDQSAINALLEARARRGQTVVRLKGGDPFVFGRGGEEAEYLLARGICVEVVPGVTSAIGVPAYAGIPVTHRGMAASFAVVTGRAGPIGEAPDIDWERIAGADTIVILMGVANHDHLIRTLQEYGRKPETPVAAIRWGTTARQHVVVGTLATIATQMRDANLHSPAILVVGEVVSLIPRLRWAERRPLFGRRVLIPAAHPTSLTEPLERVGAEVLHVALADIAPPSSWAPCDRILATMAPPRRIAFVDEVGVRACFERLRVLGRDARAFAGCRLIAESEATAEVLQRYGLRPDAVVDDWDGAAADGGSAPWIVLGEAESARLVGDALSRGGARCEVPLMGTGTVPEWRADRLRELLTTRPVDVIIFTREAQVRQLIGVLAAEERQWLERVVLACTSASSARALKEHGFDAVAVTNAGGAFYPLADRFGGGTASVSRSAVIF